jgi:hypothetical protein
MYRASSVHTSFTPCNNYDQGSLKSLFNNVCCAANFLFCYLARILDRYGLVNFFAQREFGPVLNFQKLPPVDDKITLRFAVKFCVEIAALF